MSAVRIVAHRGASAIARENTPEAVEAAIAARADLVEIDVRAAADGVPVCCHDPDLRRVVGVGARVAELGAVELARAGIFPLAAVAAVAKGRIPLVLDCKTDAPEFLRDLVDLLGPDNTPILGLRSIGAAAAARAAGIRAPLLGLLASPADGSAFVAAGGDHIRLWESEFLDAPTREAAVRLAPIWVTMGARRAGDAGQSSDERLAAVRALRPYAVLVDDPARARTPEHTE
jgi:glycerophosphoryl diester phosphodiesterase